MKYSVSIFLFSASVTTFVNAAPDDLFLTSQQLNINSSKLNLSIGLDAVQDEIDIFNFKQSEGVSNESMGDYFGGHLKSSYRFNDHWQLEGSLWQREIDLSKDTNKIQSSSLSLRYTPDLQLSKDQSLDVRLSFWGNKANELTKSTPTNVNNRTIDKVSVMNPKDYQIQLDTIFSKKLDHMNLITGIVQFGYSKVEVDHVQLQIKQHGCLIDLFINSSNQIKSKLAQKCEIDGFIVEEIDIQGNAKDFGLEVDKDLNYESYYAGFGGSWNWKYRKFESQLAYQYQYFWRNDIDDRVSAFGSNPIKDNHSLGLKLNYEISPKVSSFVKGELYKNNFIGHIPFLYNGVTASRLDRKYGLASIGLQFKMF